MKAVLKGKVVADSDDTVEKGGYVYFPRETVRLEWLEMADKTEADLACPHGVRFYDVVLDGVRHPRTAWVYEAPRGAMKHVADRVGFWKDVALR